MLPRILLALIVFLGALMLLASWSAHAATNERTARTYRAEGVAAFARSAAARRAARAEVRRNRPQQKVNPSIRKIQ